MSRGANILTIPEIALEEGLELSPPRMDEEGQRVVARASLPRQIKAALDQLRVTRREARVSMQDTFDMATYPDDGCRGFVAYVDIRSGAVGPHHRSSWGGGFTNDPVEKMVNNDRTPRPVPAGKIVVKGTEGGGRPTWAEIYVRPADAPMLLAGVK